MRRGYNRSFCYIVAVFMLVIGMCQGRVQADFCFEWDKNGMVMDFLDSWDENISSCELNAGDSVRFQELALNVKESRVESKRMLVRFGVQLLQAVIVLLCFSVFQREVEVQTPGGCFCTDTIVRYLHQKDGKK